jgi:predicted transcriptional regulator
MIENIKTTINRLGKIKLEIQFETKDLKEVQKRLDKLVDYINNELEQDFDTDVVNFYDDSKAVEDLKNIFKLEKK